ncbi:LOW QUALITY PROTEIN: hypothetical protein ACHAW6_000547 [Cyclotella cf. meneghiniana]
MNKTNKPPTYPSCNHLPNKLLHATQKSALPLPGLSKQASKANTSVDFSQSLVSIGKVSDDSTVSVFTKDDISVHCERDILIMCKAEPLFISIHHYYSDYRIPLTQHKGQWQQ